MILNDHLLFGILIFLILCSAFFSGAETSMMSINRYRLRHLVRKGNPVAKRVAKLLERPDRLLGVILIGNTFANILASSVATMIAVNYFGDIGVLFSTIILTLIILIFSETAPKTMAALQPQRLAFAVSLPLQILLRVFYPLVWFVNGIANGLLLLLRVRVQKRGIEPLSADELRTVVHEATGKISLDYQQMLLRILDLEKVTVEDVMVPRSEIRGIDLTESWEHIEQQLGQIEHEHLPLYIENIDQVQGMLNIRKVLSSWRHDKLNKERLMALADKVHYVPEGALVNRVLLNFQADQQSIGMVVDEYGDIQGLVTMQDVLEEIVGEFAIGLDDASTLIQEQEDGSVLVDGRIGVRDLKRLTNWDLPTDGPRTLSGLIIEHLEMIPQAGIGCRINGYPIEILKVSENMVRQVCVWPDKYLKFKKM